MRDDVTISASVLSVSKQLALFCDIFLKSFNLRVGLAQFCPLVRKSVERPLILWFEILSLSGLTPFSETRESWEGQLHLLFERVEGCTRMNYTPYIIQQKSLHPSFHTLFLPFMPWIESVLHFHIPSLQRLATQSPKWEVRLVLVYWEEALWKKEEKIENASLFRSPFQSL